MPRRSPGHHGAPDGVARAAPPVPSEFVSPERTNDPVVALGWAFDLLGAGSAAAFLLAPRRFEYAERTRDSLSLTLGGERLFGAAFGPRPPLNADWDTCVVSASTFGPSLGGLVRADRWDFFSREVSGADGPDLEVVTDHREIAALLTSAAPHSRVWPENPEIVAWYGLRDQRGLASIAALVKWESGHHVVSSVATRVDARGRGLSTTVMNGVVAAASRRNIAWLGLGVAHDNSVAQGVYLRTGFTCRAEFSVYRSADDHSAGHG